MGRLSLWLFGISEAEVRFSKRGFRGGDEPAHEHLERSGSAFVRGYRAGLEEDRVSLLATRLDAIDLDLRGFAYEGAAMGLRLRAFFLPAAARRLTEYLRGPGAPHCYLVHVGIGWAIARLPVSLATEVRRYEPYLGWLVADGYGFHRAFFDPRKWVDDATPPPFAGYTRRAFDQGLGRALWFIEGAGPERIAARIAQLAPERRGDVWSGTGLACAYAGGIDRAAVERLGELAAEHRREVMQGVAFASEARARGGNLTPGTELACAVFWGRPAAEIAAATEREGHDLPLAEPETMYEVWRQRVQHLAEQSMQQEAAQHGAMPATA